VPRAKRLQVRPDGQVQVADPETLKVIADPLRLELLSLLGEPRTAKELAISLGVPTTRLYYHLRMLERHGLVKVVSTRLVSGIEEKTYRSLGNNWEPAPELTDAALESSGVVGSLVNLVEAELSMALRGEPKGHIGDPDSAAPFLTLTRMSFDRESLVEFQKRLYELLEQYATPEPAAREGEDLYHLFLALYRYAGGAPHVAPKRPKAGPKAGKPANTRTRK
jgi:DNA-binding transcriptional ArsR family regulator